MVTIDVGLSAYYLLTKILLLCIRHSLTNADKRTQSLTTPQHTVYTSFFYKSFYNNLTSQQLTKVRNICTQKLFNRNKTPQRL